MTLTHKFGSKRPSFVQENIKKKIAIVAWLFNEYDNARLRPGHRYGGPGDENPPCDHSKPIKWS